MANLNLLDVARLNGNSALVGLIEENQSAAPEAANWPVKVINGTSYSTLIRTALPTPGFRKANEGSAGVKSTYEKKLVECFIASEALKIDKAVADAYEFGPDELKAMEADGMVRALLQLIGKQAYYGTTSNGDSDGFPGLIDICDSNFIVDAAGTTATTGSSVYALRFGNKGVSLVLGNNAGMTLGDWREEFVLDSGGTNSFNAYVAALDLWVGMQATDISAVGRIADLTADSSCTLTDDHISDLLAKFPVGGAPDALYMNRRSLQQLPDSRTATNPTGAPAPFPNSAFGIPIVVTDSILSTETLNYNLS